jgi:hypothetical protein
MARAPYRYAVGVPPEPGCSERVWLLNVLQITSFKSIEEICGYTEPVAKYISQNMI